GQEGRGGLLTSPVSGAISSKLSGATVKLAGKWHGSFGANCHLACNHCGRGVNGDPLRVSNRSGWVAAKRRNRFIQEAFDAAPEDDYPPPDGDRAFHRRGHMGGRCSREDAIEQGTVSHPLPRQRSAARLEWGVQPDP